MPRGKKKKGKPGRPRKVKTPEEQPSTPSRDHSYTCHVCGKNVPLSQVLCVQRIIEKKGKGETERGGPLCRQCGGYE